MSPWWALLLPPGAWAARETWRGARDFAEDLRRAGLSAPWQRKAAESGPEPELPAAAPFEAAAPAAPSFTLIEEVQLSDLAARRAMASDGAREAGEDLASRLTVALPDMRAADIARVLLALEPALSDATDGEEPDWALIVIKDSLLGAPAVLAERAFLDGDRGIEWLTEETGARDGR